MRTELRVERGGQVFVWEGELPLIPEGQLISTPEVAATRVVASIIAIAEDGSVTQRLAGR